MQFCGQQFYELRWRKVQCIKFGMPELWTCRYDHWALPVTVESPNESGIVLVKLAAIALLQKQLAAADYFFSKICYRKDLELGGWWVELAQLSQYAHKEAPGTYPEDCVRWAPALFREEVREGDFKDMEGFFEQFAAAGWFKTPKSAELIFHAFCKHMMYWLCVKRTAVDLGFCRILPLPFRVNWKEVLLYRIMGKRTGIKYVGDVRNRFRPEMLHFTDLLAARKGKRAVMWTLEILPKKWWYETSLKKEERRRIKELNSLYWLDVGKDVGNATEDATKCFMAYLGQVALPTVHVFENLLLRNRVPDPHRPYTYYRTFDFPPCPNFQVVRSSEGLNEFGGISIDVSPESPQVRSLWPVQQGPWNVRDTGRDDSRPRNASGMFVPHAAQSQGGEG
jgi:hypothetical protein